MHYILIFMLNLNINLFSSSLILNGSICDGTQMEGDYYYPDLKKQKNILPAVIKMKLRGVCTATFIRKDVILTAHHCLEVPTSVLEKDIPVKKIKFYKGNSELLDIHVSKVVLFKEKENKNKLYDIALLFLQKEIDDNEIKPIEISKIKPKINDKIMILGYGHTKILHKRMAKPYDTYNKTLEDDGHKRCGENIINNFIKLETVEYSDIDSLKITYKNGATVLPGDSGGPMIQYQDGQAKIVAIPGGIKPKYRWYRGKSNENLFIPLFPYSENLNLLRYIEKVIEAYEYEKIKKSLKSFK